jgi:hypothetical protein
MAGAMPGINMETTLMQGGHDRCTHFSGANPAVRRTRAGSSQMAELGIGTHSQAF